MSDDEFESLADGSWKYEIESLRQQLDGWIAANSPNGWIDNLRQQLVTLKTELKSIGEAIDDPRTDLTMTMSEIIIELKQQLAGANARIEAMSHQYKDLQRQHAALRQKEWLSRKLAVAAEPGGIMACEPSRLDTLNDELQLARQANEAQHGLPKRDFNNYPE